MSRFFEKYVLKILFYSEGKGFIHKILLIYHFAKYRFCEMIKQGGLNIVIN